jgi:protease-4
MKIIRYIFVALAIYIVLGVVAGIALETFIGGPKFEVANGSVIEMTIGADYGEKSSPSLSKLLEGRSSLPHFSVLNTLRRATDDPRIEGLSLYVTGPGLGFAQLQELSEAFDAFHAAGKWSQSFIETAGEGGSGTMAYLIASMAQRVSVSPPGDVNFVPLASTQLFFKETLESLNIDVKVYQRKEFKSAGEFLSRTNMSPSAKEALKALLDDIQSDVIGLVARNRDVDPSVVRQWLETPVNGSLEALERGLIDERAYEDEVQSYAKSKLGPEGAVIAFEDYAQEGYRFDGEKRLALIIAEGEITRGEAAPSLSGEETGIASAPYQRAFREAREDKVEAVLLRVNSPGGSYIGSDLIRREVELTVKAGIPVIVSMGDLAASGGYFISFDASKVFANSGTLTGSIGVIMMDISIRRALEERLKVGIDGYRTFESAEIFDPLAKSERREAYLDASIDRIYEDFITKAAAGRKMEVKEFESLAKGRVWTGRAAKERDLVDALGGYESAIQETLLQAKVGAEGASFYQYPRAETPLEELLLSLSNVTMSLETLSRLVHVLSVPPTSEAQVRMPQLNID